MKPSDTAPPVHVEPSTREPRMWHVLVIALVVSLFAVVWLVVYDEISTLIWEDAFLAVNRWAIPVGVLFFSLLVGLVERYLHAPNMIHGGAEESLHAGDVTTYRVFWGTLLSSFLSLWSGASIGPEAPLGILAVQISEWIASKLRLAKQGTILVALAGMAAAYNGIVGSPVFATLAVSEGNAGKGGLALIRSNLAAGATGFLVFSLLGVPAFAGFLDVGQVTELSVAHVAYAILLGLVGAVVAVYMGLVTRGAGRLFSVFDEQPIRRIMIGAAIIAVVCYFIPELMFSGEKQIRAIMDHAAQVGVAMLLVMALLKPLLLAISLKSGYLGGPIFPALFSAVMVGLAVNLLLPGIPLAIVIPCLEVAVVTLLLRAPLTSIMLVAVVTLVTSTMLGLITVSAVTSMIAGIVLRELLERRGSRTDGPETPVPAGG